MLADMTVVKQKMQVDMQQEPTVIGAFLMFKMNLKMALSNGLRDAVDKGCTEASLEKIRGMGGLLDNNNETLTALVANTAAAAEPLPGLSDSGASPSEEPPEAQKMREDMEKETTAVGGFLVCRAALKTALAQGLTEADNQGCTDEQLGGLRNIDTLLSHDDDTLAALIANTASRAEPRAGEPGSVPSVAAKTEAPEKHDPTPEELEEEKRKGVTPGEGQTTPATGPTIDLSTHGVSSGADGGTTDSIGSKGPVQEPAEGAPAGPAADTPAEAAGGATHIPQTTINSGTKL